jgi:adenosylmethionine-8-amino-7-oxononanoate aminotransferase
VRVKGAIGVVELDRIENLNTLRQSFIAEGVFIRPFGNIVYLTPAFTIGSDELMKLTGAIAKVLKKAD